MHLYIFPEIALQGGLVSGSYLAELSHPPALAPSPLLPTLALRRSGGAPAAGTGGPGLWSFSSGLGCRCGNSA